MRAKTAQTRQHMIAMALQIFHEHGVENTTIDMICQASNSSVGSLYHHFGNKEGLAAQVYLAGLSDFSRCLFQALTDCQHVQQAIYRIVEANIDWICANPIWATFIFEQRHLLKQAAQEGTLVNSVQDMESQMQQRFAQLQGYESIAQWPAEIFSSLLVGATHDYARHWLNGRRSTPLSTLKPYFMQAAWHSLQVTNFSLVD